MVRLRSSALLGLCHRMLPADDCPHMNAVGCIDGREGINGRLRSCVEGMVHRRACATVHVVARNAVVQAWGKVQTHHGATLLTSWRELVRQPEMSGACPTDKWMTQGVVVVAKQCCVAECSSFLVETDFWSFWWFPVDWAGLTNHSQHIFASLGNAWCVGKQYQQPLVRRSK